jgi:hypothetical protein
MFSDIRHRFSCKTKSVRLVLRAASSGMLGMSDFEMRCRIEGAFCISEFRESLTLSDPTSNLVRQYDFSVLLRCRKTSDTVFIAFVCPLSEPVRRFSSCSLDFSQQIAQVVLFLFLHVFFSFKTVG